MCLPGQQEGSAHSRRPGRLLRGRAIRQRGLQRRKRHSEFSFPQEAFLWQSGLQRNLQTCAGATSRNAAIRLCRADGTFNLARLR